MIKKIDQALKERYEICAKHSPAVSILVFLSEAQPHGGTEFPGPPGRGDVESSVIGAEAPTYYQGVLPDFAKASSGRPGRYV